MAKFSGKTKSGRKVIIVKKAMKKAPASFAKRVLAVVKREEETKYVAEQLDDAAQVLTTLVIPGDLGRVVPRCGIGAGSFQRQGNRINNVRGKTHFTFSMQNTNLSTANWIVRVYMLSSKQAKAEPQVATLSAATLLDNGDGTTIDWNPAATSVVSLAQRPLSNENFSGTFKEFHLSKGDNAMNASLAASTANSTYYAQHAKFTWHWKHKSALIYDEAGNLPTNYAPQYAVVAYVVDGYNITPVASAPILWSTRTEMYYKDM